MRHFERLTMGIVCILLTACFVTLFAFAAWLVALAAPAFTAEQYLRGFRAIGTALCLAYFFGYVIDRVENRKGGD